jgi:hypothetical protein
MDIAYYEYALELVERRRAGRLARPVGRGFRA